MRLIAFVGRGFFFDLLWGSEFRVISDWLLRVWSWIGVDAYRQFIFWP
jgi:hypothetical protein